MTMQLEMNLQDDAALDSPAEAIYTPAIRFKGFGGAWEKKKIGDILAEVKRPIELLDAERYQLVTVKRRNEGVVPRSLLKGSEILVKNYFSIKSGDFLISKRQVVHGANGIVPDQLDNAVVSNEYLVITDSQHITAKFWTAISKKPEMHKLFFVSSYGVDIEKLVFDVSDWGKKTIVIPTVSEQIRITEYLQQLDSLIAQHQHKHTKLLNLKQALLQKMFPKQGATVPEVRFKGFSGDWENLEINEIFEVTRGNVLAATATVERPTEEMPYPVYSSQTKNKGLMGYYNKFLFENAITWTTDGANAGTVSYRDGKFYSTNVNGVLLSADGYANKALAEILNLIAWKHVSYVGNPKLMNNVMSKIKIRVPCSLEEQKLISNLLDSLDHLITQQHALLTKLGNLKQAYLAKMFI